MKNKKVVIFGVFDCVHKGHLYLIKNAKKEGNTLIAIIARDKIVKKLKGKLPKFKEDERSKTVSRLSYIDKVFLGDKKIDTYNVLREIKPDVIYLGYDQNELFLSLSLFIKKGNLSKTRIIIGKAYKPKIFHSSILKRL